MIRVEYDGATYRVDPQESVLAALIRGGADIEFSCREGACQTCMMRAADGDPGHEATEALRDELVDSGHFLPCVCRPDENLRIEQPDRSELYADGIVSGKEPLSPTVVRLQIEPARDLEWTPGQYVNLRRGDGLTRSYSIASIAEVDYFLELHVRRHQDGRMSTWIHDDLEAGDFVRLQGPLGQCTYRDEFDGRPLLLVATGTGIAPLYGVARDALRRGHDGPIRVYHGERNTEELYLEEEFRALADAYDQLEWVPCLSGEEVPDGYRPGWVTDHVFDDHSDADGHVLYLCGNPDMVYDARHHAIRAGIAREDIVADPFESNQPYMPDDAAKLEGVEPDPELWEALDEGTGLREILEDFYDRVYDDPRLSPFFEEVTKDHAISKQYAFLSEVFSGEDNYFGLYPFNAHHWMIISDDLFDHRENLFEECVRRYGLPEHLVRRWMAFHEMFRREIVKSSARGIMRDGEELHKTGFSEEEVLVGTICDGCASEIPAGSTGQMHRRTGKFFCDDCSADEAVDAIGTPA